MRLIRRAFFRMLSQLAIEYHDSWLSAGHAGHVRGADRSSWSRDWLDTEAGTTTISSSRRWDQYFIGTAVAARSATRAKRRLPYGLRIFPGVCIQGSRPSPNAMYLMRWPDEHIRSSTRPADLAVLERVPSRSDSRQATFQRKPLSISSRLQRSSEKRQCPAHHRPALCRACSCPGLTARGRFSRSRSDHGDHGDIQVRPIRSSRPAVSADRT